MKLCHVHTIFVLPIIDPYDACDKLSINLKKFVEVLRLRGTSVSATSQKLFHVKIQKL